MDKLVKRMIFNLLACVVLVALAFVAFNHYRDSLALVLFGLAIIPSCMFEEARKEWKGE